MKGILDLPASKLWPGDHIEEGVMVVEVFIYHPWVEITTINNDRMVIQTVSSDTTIRVIRPGGFVADICMDDSGHVRFTLSDDITV